MRERLKRWRQRFGRASAWTAGILLALSLAMAAMLQLPPVRNLIREKALGAVQGSLKGKLDLQDLRWPTPEYFTLSGLELSDRHGQRVAAFSTLLARLRLSSLLGGQVELTRLEVSDLYVDLADLGAEHGLLSVLASAEPKPPPDPKAGMSPITIVIHELCIAHGQLHVVPAEGQAIQLRALDTCVKLRVGDDLYVAIGKLTAEVLRNDVLVAQLQELDKLPKLGDLSAPAVMQAQLAGQLQFASADDMSFDTELHARGFSPASLRALGVATDVLRGPVDLDLRAVQQKKQLRYRTLIASAAGSVMAHGALSPERVLTLAMETEALTLSECTNLDLDTFGFALEAQVALDKPERTGLTLEVPHGYFGRWPLPKVSAKAARAADGDIALESLRAIYERTQLEARGHYKASGAIAADATIKSPDLAEIAPVHAADPSLHGALDAHVTLQRGVDQLVSGNVELALSQFKNSAARVGRAQVTATVAGKIEQPVARVSLHAESLQIAQRQVQRVDFLLTGGPQRYLFELEADRDWLRIDGWGDHVSDGWDAGFTLSSKQPEGLISANLASMHVRPGESLDIDQLRAYFQKAQLIVDGKVDLKGGDNKLRVGATVPDIAQLMKALGREGVPGRAELIATVRGALDKPKAELKLRYSHGIQLEGKPVDVKLAVKADAPQGKAQVELEALTGAGPTRGRVVTQLKTHWPARLPLSAVANAAEHELSIQLERLSLPMLLDPKNPEPQRWLDGLLDGTITAAGNQKKLVFATHLASRVSAARDMRSIDVVVDSKYENAQFALAVQAGDKRGQLLAINASADIEVERQIRKPSKPEALIDGLRWRMDTELSERSLLDLPLVKSFDFGNELRPILASLRSQIKHEPHSEPVATLDAQLRWQPRAAGLRKVATTCHDRIAGQLKIAGKWADQKLGIDIRGGTTPDAENLHVAAGMPLSVEQALKGGVKNLAGAQLVATLHELDLALVPMLCDQAAGTVSLTAKASDPLTAQADVMMELETKGVQWEKSPPLAVQLAVQSEDKALRVSGQMASADGALHFAGKVPVDVHATDASQALRRSDPLALDLQLQRLPMAALLAYAPGVARVSGTSTGSIQLRGALDKLDPRGELDLDDVSLTLPRLGQRFAHVHLKVQLGDKTIRLSEGKFRDLTGSATLAALIHLGDRDTLRAELNVNARNFPVRKSGVILGHADADVRIVADMKPDHGQIDVGLKGVAVELSGDGMGDVQTLEPHPEFSFADVRGVPEQMLAEEPEKPSVPMTIHIQSEEPLWVRRDDFAVQMQPDLTIIVAGKKPLMKGKIDLLRGYISLLGQNFDIKRGQVVLGGSEEVDPQLEITAVHQSPRGAAVQLEVKGFVSQPQLTFRIEGNPNPVTAGEALFAINGRGGDTGSTAPEKQVANAAIGMATGLLSLGARREFGDWVPMLQVEQGDQTRVRVGLEADRFVPKFLKGFVRGAYVEGIVATESTNPGGAGTSSAQTNNASGNGVLLELTLPKNFVWAGQYGPGTAWSVDLDWRP